MKEAEISYEYGRLWWGDPALRYRYVPTEYLESTVRAVKNPAMKDTSAVAARVKLTGRDGGNNFGILGCQFMPDRTDQLSIRVGILADEFDVYPPEPSLPTELAQAVFDQSITFVQTRDIPGAGTLSFDIGLCHVIHSGPRIFRLLTRVIIQALDPRIFWTQSEVGQLFRNELRNMDSYQDLK